LSSAAMASTWWRVRELYCPTMCERSCFFYIYNDLCYRDTWWIFACLFFLYFQIYAEATLVFPLLVAETFAKRYHATKVKAESDVWACTVFELHLKLCVFVSWDRTCSWYKNNGIASYVNQTSLILVPKLVPIYILTPDISPRSLTSQNIT
jgi:hypothetical protein